MKPRVAICQSAIMPGGRFRVLLGMVEVLNNMGIQPEIVTSQLKFQPSEIAKIYGRSPKVRFRYLPYIRLHPEFSIIFFNWMLNRFASEYDLIINTSNSLIFLPPKKKVISYVFYPRESRVQADVFSIHNPEHKIPAYSPEYYTRKVLRRIYRHSKLHAEHKIICMTQFTRSALEQVYPISTQLPVIYPPVEVDALKQADEVLSNRKSIITAGRFTPDKRQLEQIRLAAELPDFDVHIVGFVSNRKYYKKCEELVENLGVKNAYLHPNAPFDEMARIFRQSRYFLHSLIDEPFGITAVQSIAAGCMPIVHDSGGQREVVPYPELRFSNMDEIPALLDNLEKMSDKRFEMLQNELCNHVNNTFTDAIFYEKMKDVLEPYLQDASQ